MIRVMIAVEENGKSKVYTIGGDKVEFWKDIQSMMKHEDIVQFHADDSSAEDILSDIAEVMGKNQKVFA